MRKWIGQAIAALALGVAIGWMVAGDSGNGGLELAEKTLRSLYEFETLEQFGENVETFRECVTPELFDRMTADNSDRVLRVYLKFNGRPSYVDIVEARPGCIVYSLVCESIERDRLFAFVYEAEGGVITEIREAELFAFPTTRGWEYDPSVLPPLGAEFGGG